MIKRSPADSAKLDAAIVAGIHAGKAIKMIAADIGTTESNCYSVLRRRLGVEKVLLFPHERDLIANFRAKKLTITRK